MSQISPPLRFDYFAAAQAGGADADSLAGAAHFGMDRSQIDIPTPLAHVVGVADIVSELRPLATEITNLCHSLLQENSELAV